VIFAAAEPICDHLPHNTRDPTPGPD